MRDLETFQAALELKQPWFVAGYRFDAAARRLEIDISFAKGARFTCPSCGAYRSPVSAERFASLYRVAMASSFFRPRAMVLGPAGRYPLEV